MKPLIEPRNRPHLAAALVALVALLLYARTVGYEYVWDDLMYLRGYAKYKGLAGAVSSFTEPFYLYSGYYRPLAMLSFVVSADAPVQHGINVLLHMVNTALVLYAARALMPRAVADSKAGLWAAGLGALLFAVHPAAVEPTAWVSGRFDTLMCTFVLGTCLVALGGDVTRRRLLWVFVLFACAMGCKEVAVGLPAALPFLWLLKWRLAGMKAAPAKAQMGALARVLAASGLGAGLYIAARLAVVQTLFAGKMMEATFSGGSVLDTLNVASLAVAAFVQLIVAPLSHSAPLHPFRYDAGSGILSQTVMAGVGVLALLALAFLKKPKLNFPLALLAALAMSWPTLHLIAIPIGKNIIADRYALAPLALLVAGLAAVAGAWIVRRAPEPGASGQRIPLYAAMVCLLWAGGLAAYSSTTIPLWRNETVFWEFVYKQVPESDHAHRGYINALVAQNRWQEAEAEIEKLWKKHPDLLEKMPLETAANWMMIRAMAGNHAGAVELFSMVEALGEDRLQQTYPGALGKLYGMRGVIEYEAGHMAQAEYYLGKAVQASPEDAGLWFRYAQALHMTGQVERSSEIFEKGLAYATDERAALEKQKRETWRRQAPIPAGAGSAP